MPWRSAVCGAVAVTDPKISFSEIIVAFICMMSEQIDSVQAWLISNEPNNVCHNQQNKIKQNIYKNIYTVYSLAFWNLKMPWRTHRDISSSINYSLQLILFHLLLPPFIHHPHCVFWFLSLPFSLSLNLTTNNPTAPTSHPVPWACSLRFTLSQ